MISRLWKWWKETMDGPSFPQVQRTDLNWIGPLPDKGSEHASVTARIYPNNHGAWVNWM